MIFSASSLLSMPEFIISDLLWSVPIITAASRTPGISPSLLEKSISVTES